nr:hypothetical protein [uncultured Selenomonas sp.]
MVAKSRSDYFKKYREEANVAQFNVTIDKGLYESLSEKLEEEQKTKRAWLEEKISEELGK